MYTMVLRLFNTNSISQNEINISGKYFDEVIAHFPNIQEITADQVSKLVAAFIMEEDLDNPAIELELESIQFHNNSIQLSFSKRGDYRILSSEIRRRLYILLNKEGLLKERNKLPVICLLNDSQKKDLLKIRPFEIIELSQKLEQYKENNDWESIYIEIKSFDELKSNPEQWNDISILETVGFALSKLSHVSERIPKSKISKNILSQKKRYREEAEKIWMRCIELEPNKVNLYSNLGYLYYQGCSELSSRYRKDGNLLIESIKAIEKLNEALEKQPNRVKDLYRKGKIYTDFLSSILSFGKCPNELLSKLNIEHTKQSIVEGINCYKKVFGFWEKHDNEDEKYRTKKEYIKSLFNCAKAYHSLVFTKWDSSKIIINQYGYDDQPNSESLSYDLNNINSALEFIRKCIINDTNKSLSSEKSLINIAKLNGRLAGVDKLHLTAKLLFKKAIIIREDAPSSEVIQSYISKSIKYIEMAVSTPFPQEREKQNKQYLNELLARIKIFNGEFENAISILKDSICRKNFVPHYILNTLALALYLNKNFSDSIEVGEKAILQRDNIAVWITHFIIAFNYIKLNNFSDAKKHLDLAKLECEKKGFSFEKEFNVANEIIVKLMNL